jgi:UDP-GlcNAc:undecaprenyl-phosphate GlcNAc-1-phosphate transferase
MKTNLIFITLLLFLSELLYLKVAEYFKILDQPNSRSSHKITTIRGGGIIFMIAMLYYPLFFSPNYPYFMAALFVAGLVSFLDDLKPINYRIRIICHFIAVSLLFVELDVFQLELYMVIIGFIIAIGIINAINFMDGINGMTGSYALITLGSLLYINLFVVKDFVENSLIITPMLAVIVFNYFNFRTRAKCFAGDVGSVSKAVILLFLIGKLIMVSGNIAYIFLLFVYGLDTVTTIVFRLLRKESIFEAHRTFFFQYLANEKKMNHLYVASVYAAVQLVFNVLLVSGLFNSWLLYVAFALVVVYVFVILRFWMEGKERLLKYTV